MGTLGVSNATVATKQTGLEHRVRWQTARVEWIEPLSRRAKLLHVSVPNWPGHLPGQHVDLRLTSSDGYQAQRNYSIASPPHEPGLSLAVEHVTNGEVSPHLTSEVRAGDVFELRGPIGGYFVWEAGTSRPLYLCAGGSGIAPFMSMLEHRRRFAAGLPTTLLYSVRSPEEAMFTESIDALARQDPALQVLWTYTRAAPPGWQGYARRVDAAMLRASGPPPDFRPLIYVCGPTPHVESIATTLLELEYRSTDIRTERFGPSGE